MTGQWSWIERATCLALMLSVGAGCGGGGDDDAQPSAMNTGTPCSAGFSFLCVTSTGCDGLQLCGTDHFLGSCICQSGSTSARDAGMPDAGARPPPGMHDASVRPPPGKVDASVPTQPANDAGAPPPASQELCDNGKDDDGDSDIDCADSDCKARSCAPKAPAGWTGPTLRDLGDNPHDCSGEYAHEVASGGTIAAADDADCSTCTCSSDTAACSPVLNFVSGASADCGGVTCTNSVSESCVELSLSSCLSTSPSYVAGALPAALASCDPSTQKPKRTAAEWDNHMVACAPDATLHQGGCAEGEVCAPETPFEGEMCIVKKGEHDCSAGPYKKRHVYYTAIDDTRGCSACACDHDCSYTWQIFDAADTTCTGTPAPIAWSDTNTCQTVTPNSGKIRIGAKISGTGSCTPSGGEPEGEVSGKNAITLCCIE